MIHQQGIIEERLIAAIALPEHLEQLLLHGIDHEDFVSMSEVFRYIRDYRTQYAQLPDRVHLETRFQREFAPTTEPFAYWLDEFVRSNASRRIQMAVREAIDLSDQDPETTLNNLQERLASIKRPRMLKIPPTDRMIAHRIERFEARMQMFLNSGGKHIIGIPTGIAAFDETNQGWLPGDATGIFARPTVGKSWFLFRCGVIAWLHGFRVLCICPEMDPAAVAIRVDTLIAGHLGMPISQSMIRQGNPAVYDAYKRLAERVAKEERWWTIQNIDGRTIKVNDIKTLALQLQPDIVLVDGLSLIEPDQKTTQAWEEIRKLSYGLRNMAGQINAHVMVSSQAVNSRRGARKETDSAAGRGDDWIMPNMNDAAFGDSFVQAMHNILTMASDQHTARAKWYSIRKAREADIADGKRRAFAWDVDRGLIADLGEQTSMEVLYGRLKGLSIKP